MESNDTQKLTASEAGWHVSRYNLYAKVPGTNNIAIFNTYRSSCAEYTPMEAFVMGALDEVSANHPLIDRLAKRGVIANFDEREAHESHNRLTCATALAGAISVTICPTMACNFECPYCFSKHGASKMSKEVQDDVVALVGRMLDAAAAKMLAITWFGGEPLLALDVIEALSPRLIALAEEHGCEYRAWVFTNGYLLSPEVVETFGRCKIKRVHIPFDGLGATNDATRRLVGGGPTFDRIIENLDLLKPPIRTLIRANTHEGNVHELDELKALVLDRAKKAGNRVDFYAASLVDVSPIDDFDNPMAALAYHGDKVSLRPETRHVPVGVDHCCGARNLWMLGIDDGGRLYKCCGKAIGHPEFAYGTAHDWDPAFPLDTASNPDMLSKYLNTSTPSPQERCYECVWLPLCGGSCPHLRLFGKHGCPPYRRDPEAFVLAMLARIGNQ